MTLKIPSTLVGGLGALGGLLFLACASACQSVPPAASAPATPATPATVAPHVYRAIGGVERLDPALALVPPDAKIEKLAEGFAWAEGPCGRRRAAAPCCSPTSPTTSSTAGRTTRASPTFCAPAATRARSRGRVSRSRCHHCIPLAHLTQVRFTIDTPPPGGVRVSANTIHSYECKANDCLWGFGLPNPITEPGKTTTVSFADFTSDSGHAFDARGFHSIGFDWAQGAFDFCVRDFQFLDASGVEVKP